MNTIGTPTVAATVYLSPQTFNPLSASTIPVAMALTARPELTDKTEKALNEHNKSNLMASRQMDGTSLVSGPDSVNGPRVVIDMQSLAGVASAGRVDVYV